ncbi:hypothetical protein GpartN1_g5276.t1 [Galdieria partita]|uniref:Proteasome subunit beta n=1 Tax=Galdieria partita TaxID=83374 RepID=A0A9C7PZU1_9RHOD|nr:hypothetical protein GpartN1_g5276.t1 [Galdieria partita]
MSQFDGAGGGFQFDLLERNEKLKEKGYRVPVARKTGTTIVGLVFREGVVLGADTRATSDTTVFDKNCEKIHYIAPNIYCCGAGTAADTENTTALVSSQLQLHRLNSGRESRVTTALTLLKRMLFRYQGYVSAALVLGGVDFYGPHLYTVYPHGSTDRLPFVTMGSGSLAAMSVFESKYKDDMSREEAEKLVYEAISAGIYNDLGSGGNVDLCVITRGQTEYLRGYAKENERKFRKPQGYSFPIGTTSILSSTFEKSFVPTPLVSDPESSSTMAVD